MLSFLKKNILLEWEVPKEWNSHTFRLSSINWKLAKKSFVLIFLSWLLLYFISENPRFNTLQIVIFASLFSIGLILLEQFVRKLSQANAYISKYELKVNYKDIRDRINIDQIESFRFKEIQINESVLTVLELKLKKGKTFDVGIPSSNFSSEIKTVLSETLNIPCFGSDKS